MNSRKRALIFANILFYLMILVLTLCSKKIYRSSLPSVRIGYLEQRIFENQGKSKYLVAIPEYLATNDIYCVRIEDKNGENCYFVESVKDIVLGAERDGYYPVETGLSEFVPLVLDYEGNLIDGQEVFVENEEDIIW